MVGTGNDKDGARAVISVAVAALVQFDEGLVVVGQFGQVDSLEGEGAAGVVEYAVEGCVLTVVAFDMVVLVAPAELNGVEHSGGDNHLLALDVAELAGCDQRGVVLDIEFRAMHFVGFHKLHVALSVAPKADQQAREAAIIGQGSEVAGFFAPGSGTVVPNGLERLHIEFQLVAVDGAGVAGEAVDLVGVEMDVR